MQCDSYRVAGDHHSQFIVGRNLPYFRVPNLISNSNVSRAGVCPQCRR